MTSLMLAAAVAVALLGWLLYRRLVSDRLNEMNDRRRATSRLVGEGEYVDGNRHLAVALALTDSTFFYENADMQASLELHRIREIEYDTELATGTAPENGSVLRLRSGSQTFEFVIPALTAGRWQEMLPPRGATAPHLTAAQGVTTV